MKPNFFHLLVTVVALTFPTSSIAQSSIADARCFPIYRQAGFVPNGNCHPECLAFPPDELRECAENIESFNRYCSSTYKESTCSVDVGNPIDASSGNKHQTERDYSGAGSFPLLIERYYNSSPTRAGGSDLGSVWRWTYSRSVNLTRSRSGAYVTRPNGTIVMFYSSNWRGSWLADYDINDELTSILAASGQLLGWKYRNSSDGSVELYDAAGRLNSITARSGQRHTLTRSTSSTPNAVAPGPDYVIRVTDHFGRQLNLEWNRDGTLARIIDPEGNVYAYDYDSDKRLMGVTYPPGGTGGSKRAYLYNELEHTSNTDAPGMLTGIVGENGIRLATYEYDELGRGITTQHAGGVNRYSLAYGSNETLVTDPLGTSRKFRFTNVVGALRLEGVDQPGGAGCAAAMNGLQYDYSGNVVSRIDFRGSVTNYIYDGTYTYEHKRTEAAGTPNARTVTTDWNLTVRLPARIFEPNSRTAYTYTPKGLIETKTLQATNDPTGDKGNLATLVGKPRTWRYRYNAAGQILSVTGPRTDIRDTTTYGYDDATGNLITISNALGHITRMSDYDAHGRVRKIVEANGVTTSLAYSPRGWLTARTESAAGASRVTRFEYDEAGQLKKVIMPDDSIITYRYDDAQRLIGMSDGVGNAIDYTLDNLGNRIRETVTDSSGKLASMTSRTFDELNRLKSANGAAQ